MSLAIPAHVQRSKRRAFVATTLSSLILCIICPNLAQAVAEAVHKTDAELAKTLVGTWEIPPSMVEFSKEFLAYNADGTSKITLISNDRGSPRRVEFEGTWRVSQGYLIEEMTKVAPPQRHNMHLPLKGRLQIESIENETVKLRGEKGHEREMRRISHLPSLPPLLTWETWAPELSAAEIKKAAISAPQPDYPIDARRKRIEGSGIFKLTVAKDGSVNSFQVLKSTGSKILDDAAERTLRQWRFKPGNVKGMKVPISFALTHR